MTRFFITSRQVHWGLYSRQQYKKTKQNKNQYKTRTVLLECREYVMETDHYLQRSTVSWIDSEFYSHRVLCIPVEGSCGKFTPSVLQETTYNPGWLTVPGVQSVIFRAGSMVVSRHTQADIVLQKYRVLHLEGVKRGLFTSYPGGAPQSLPPQWCTSSTKVMLILLQQGQTFY